MNEDGTDQNIAQLFSLIEKNKDNLHLETYSLSQTTLEEVFLSFAKSQISIEDADKLAENQKKVESQNLTHNAASPNLSKISISELKSRKIKNSLTPV